MADEIEHLILGPFREIANKGNQTMQNAQNAATSKASQMRKSGQALAREAQRAVKKLEPLCNRHLEESGAYFIDAVKDEDEITKHRWLLNEKLWDFDDYIEPDTFEPAEFVYLQRLSREAAPRILDILMTMRLDVPLPLYTLPPNPFVQNSFKSMMGTQSGPGEGLEGPRPRTLSGGDLVDRLSRHILESAPDEPPVIPPKSRSRKIVDPQEDNRERRPKSELQTPNPNRRSPRATLLASSPVSPSKEQSRLEPLSSSFSPENPPIPEEGAIECSPDSSPTPGERIFQSGSLRSLSSQRISTDSIHSSVLDLKSPDYIPKRNSSLSVSSALYSSPALTTTSTPASSPGSKAKSQDTAIYRPSNASSGPLQPAAVVAANMEDGLMPVQSEAALPNFAIRQPDTSIGPESSFYQYGGFCEGAKEVQHGGLGVKKAKRRGIWNVARCKHCMFELDWDKIEEDVGDRLNRVERKNNEENSRRAKQNLNLLSIRFRISFLLKCHLPTKNVDESLYGCVFCIARGCTSEEADATVFFTQDQLFAHLSRHPRPLPTVPGVLVAEGPEDAISAKIANTADLHFKEPPAPPALAGITKDISRLPTATAAEATSRPTAFLPPGQATPTLQFAVGARIMGIQFPDQYNGEWAIGWADGMRGAFPTNAVRFDVPLPGEVKLQLSSSLVASARWNWAPKERASSERSKWLRLDKGETITNICWLYEDHWCWSGTNTKGIWGLFPQSHVEPRSVRDLNGELPSQDESQRDVSTTHPGSRSGFTMLSSMMRRLSLRKDSMETKEKGPRLVIY